MPKDPANDASVRSSSGYPAASMPVKALSGWWALTLINEQRARVKQIT
jgi:hypothetical protein